MTSMGAVLSSAHCVIDLAEMVVGAGCRPHASSEQGREILGPVCRESACGSMCHLSIVGSWSPEVHVVAAFSADQFVRVLSM